jgi:hypothetical protein
MVVAIAIAINGKKTLSTLTGYLITSERYETPSEKNHTTEASAKTVPGRAPTTASITHST